MPRYLANPSRGPRCGPVRASGRRISADVSGIRSALEREGTRVIPVLVQGAAMASARDLPEDLVRLARRNAVELRDARWAGDVSRLVRALERIAAEKAASGARAVAGAGIDRTPTLRRTRGAPRLAAARAR